MRGLFTIFLYLIGITVFAQNIHVGTQFSAGLMAVNSDPFEVYFSTTDNEVNYVDGIKDTRMLVLPSLINLSYENKNRLRIFTDLRIVRYSYDFAMRVEPTQSYLSAISGPDPFELQVNTNYVSSTIGLQYEIFPNKVVRPYVGAGFSQNILLGYSERIPEKYYVGDYFSFDEVRRFTQMEGREIRNTIIYNNVNKFEPIVSWAMVEAGVKVYNVMVFARWEQALTLLDSEEFYKNQRTLSLGLGVDLLSVNLTKRQKN